MTELEKIAYAKSFIDKLAEGINPLDGTPVPEGDVVNNVRLSRCFFYVSDILRQVIDNGGVVASRPAKQIKPEFHLTDEQRQAFEASKKPISVSDITEKLNDMTDPEAMQKLPVTAITGWLVTVGMLETVTGTDGKSNKRPTEQGRAVGIMTEQRTGQYGTYTAVLYNEEAQRFILDHIDAIIAYRVSEKEQRQAAKDEKKAVRKAEKQSNDLSGFHNRPWTPEHDERLSYLFYSNKTITEIAYDLRRTEEGVRGRLAVLGLIQP